MIKTILKKIYTKCSFLTRHLYGGIGHILMFHRVCPRSSAARISANAGMEVTPEKMEDIFRFFKAHYYEFISLDQMVQQLKQSQRGKINKKFVVFTFDDGYVDNFTHAYPLFKKHNIPFTIYVTTNFPDRSAILWWYLLEELLLETDKLVVKTGSQVNEFNCASMDEKEETFNHIRLNIMDCSANDYTDMIENIFESYNINMYQKTADLTLSWEQIEQLNKDPLVTIGAHTVNHYALSKLSQAEAKQEILESKRKIESHLNCEVNHFAYPFGGRDEAGKGEFETVKEYGFKTAVTTRFASVFPQHKHHLLCLPRIFIHSGADNRFFKQLINGTLTGMANKFKRVVTV